MPERSSEQLVFVDLRGGGQSTGQPADLTFDVLAQDLEAVRRALGVERVRVLGHSILGILAIEYAKRCPESVSHAITVGTPPRGGMDWLSEKATAFFERDASQGRKRVWRENREALGLDPPQGLAFVAQAPMRFFDPRTDVGSLFAGAEVRPALLAHLLGALTSEWEVTRNAQSLHVPILLAHGRYDYTVPWVLWDGIAEQLPEATRHVFQRSGHHPFCEEPDEFARVVREWMNHEAK